VLGDKSHCRNVAWKFTCLALGRETCDPGVIVNAPIRSFTLLSRSDRTVKTCGAAMSARAVEIPRAATVRFRVWLWQDVGGSLSFENDSGPRAWTFFWRCPAHCRSCFSTILHMCSQLTGDATRSVSRRTVLAHATLTTHHGGQLSLMKHLGCSVSSCR
jgi:hypothetical protein